MSIGRGEIWLADLNPTQGHKQAGRRPVAVVSEDSLNSGPAGLVVVLPITSTIRPIPSQIVVAPPEGGLTVRSAVICEAIRSISTDRLVERWGRLGPKSLARIEDVLRILLRL
ncbi:MAG: type II toxin-antitoxin system PemK/MazF family toxin [Vicinamibacteria bacterium]